MKYFLYALQLSLGLLLVSPTWAAGGRQSSNSVEPVRVEGRAPRQGMVQLQGGPGYLTFRPERSWGRPQVVGLLSQALQRLHKEHPEAPPVLVQDLSRRRGGRLPPHISHRRGRDVDIRLMVRWSRDPFARITPTTIDRERLWSLLVKLVASGEVRVILLDYSIQRLLHRHARSRGVPREVLAEVLQYPRGRRSWAGVVRHWSGHADHLHVSFHRAPSAPASPTDVPSGQEQLLAGEARSGSLAGGTSDASLPERQLSCVVELEAITCCRDGERGSR